MDFFFVEECFVNGFLKDFNKDVFFFSIFWIVESIEKFFLGFYKCFFFFFGSWF